eukprot:10169245-Lingulodinium_polyedra.AAC.1
MPYFWLNLPTRLPNAGSHGFCRAASVNLSQPAWHTDFRAQQMCFDGFAGETKTHAHATPKLPHWARARHTLLTLKTGVT